MKTLIGHRKIWFVVFLLAFVVGVLALGPHPREVSAASNCTYFSNASHTTVVGRFGRDCCNNNVAWGIKTQFSECGGCLPCTPPPR